MESRRLGTPTREAAEVLISEVEERIEAYEALGQNEEDPVEHEMSRQFLDTEHQVLRNVLAEVKKIVKTIPYAAQTNSKSQQSGKQSRDEEEEEEEEEEEGDDEL